MLNQRDEVELDVPEMISQRILCAAENKAKAYARHRRIVHNTTWALSIAAVVAMFIGGGVFFLEPESPIAPPVASGELAKMNDWGWVEQENYNLTVDINSGFDAVEDM